MKVSAGLLLGLVVLPGAAPAEETRFAEGFLCLGKDGLVRFGEPIAYLGMYGRMAGTVEERFHPDVAKTLAPFVNRIDSLADKPEPDFYFDAFLKKPNAGFKEVPTILLGLEVSPEFRKEVKEKEKTLMGGVHSVYEIVSARVVHAERLSEKWLEAWRRLDRTLEEIVVQSLLETPGQEKRKHLAELIESGNASLSAMVSEDISAEFRDLVLKVDPRARAVRIFERQKSIAWGSQLGKLSARLRIEPSKPFPVLEKTFPLLEWCAETASQAAFMEKIKAAGDREAFESLVLHFKETRPSPGGGQFAVYRPVFAWEVESLSPQDFERLKSEARKRLEKDKAEPRRPPPSEAKGSVASKNVGANLRAATDDELADKMVLAGFVVESLLPEGPDVGLKPGDLIPAYQSLYDVVMSSGVNEYAVRAVLSRAERWKALRVFRGSEVVTLPLK